MLTDISRHIKKLWVKHKNSYLNFTCLQYIDIDLSAVNGRRLSRCHAAGRRSCPPHLPAPRYGYLCVRVVRKYVPLSTQTHTIVDTTPCWFGEQGNLGPVVVGGQRHKIDDRTDQTFGNVIVHYREDEV